MAAWEGYAWDFLPSFALFDVPRQVLTTCGFGRYGLLFPSYLLVAFLSSGILAVVI
jgi:hypothetical protein